MLGPARFYARNAKMVQWIGNLLVPHYIIDSKEINHMITSYATKAFAKNLTPFSDNS
jgi:hypothetical protein